MTYVQLSIKKQQTDVKHLLYQLTVLPSVVTLISFHESLVIACQNLATCTYLHLLGSVVKPGFVAQRPWLSSKMDKELLVKQTCLKHHIIT